MKNTLEVGSATWVEVLQKILVKFHLSEDNDWVKKYMEYEVEGPRPNRTWRYVVKEDCQARKLNTEDAIDRSKWRKLIKDV